MAAGKHIVKTLRVEAEGIPIQQQHSWRTNAASYFQQSFPKLLNEVLNDIFPEEDFFKIDQLVIQLRCSNINIDDLLKDLLHAELVKQLQVVKEPLSLRPPDSKMPVSSVEKSHEHYLEAFIFFLQHGYYPWWAKANNDACLYAIQNNANAKALLLPVLKEKNVVKRLAYAVDDELFFAVLSLVTAKSVNDLKNIQLQFIQNFSTAIQGVPVVTEIKKLSLVVFKIILSSFFEEQNFVGSIVQLEKSSISVIEFIKTNKVNTPVQLINGIEDLLLSNNKKTIQVTGLAEEGIWIGNAGIVILHPFLPMLFKRLEIADDADQITNYGKAMLVLHYLIYGNVQFNEAALPLCKLLCGLDLSEPVAVLNGLSKNEMQECDDLLLSVITHWAALKNTSPAGLRNSFFYRNAKLYKHGDSWELLVEPKTEDVLLDKLPWSISYIKLSWMKTMLHTIWIN